MAEPSVRTVLALHDRRIGLLEGIFQEGLMWLRGIAIGVLVGVILLVIQVYRTKGV